MPESFSLPPLYVHPAAEVSVSAQVGAGSRIWSHAQVREQVSIGEECNIGKGVYIDARVQIGSRVKIQNYSSIFEGVTLEDGVFVGPHVCFTNDMFPRAITLEGQLKSADDWQVTPTLAGYGASIGAGSVIRCGITIGQFALVGAGSVVTHDVAPHALVFGNPARQHGYVCRCGHPLTQLSLEAEPHPTGWCASCQQTCILPAVVGTAREEPR
jgi:UDP-2-acetamido-3-amino-2,3-dideoxy-glucuronate N-acetyltransferase